MGYTDNAETVLCTSGLSYSVCYTFRYDGSRVALIHADVSVPQSDIDRLREGATAVGIYYNKDMCLAAPTITQPDIDTLTEITGTQMVSLSMTDTGVPSIDDCNLTAQVKTIEDAMRCQRKLDGCLLPDAAFLGAYTWYSNSGECLILPPSPLGGTTALVNHKNIKVGKYLNHSFQSEQQKAEFIDVVKYFQQRYAQGNHFKLLQQRIQSQELITWAVTLKELFRLTTR
eukprot:gene3900-4511_t